MAFVASFSLQNVQEPRPATLLLSLAELRPQHALTLFSTLLYTPDAASTSIVTDSPYPDTLRSTRGRRSQFGSLSEKYSLDVDPRKWGSNLSVDVPEPDDYVYAPAHDMHAGSAHISKRAISNLGCLFILIICILGLFIGYPIATFQIHFVSTQGGFNLGGLNASGQVPDIGNHGLIDLDTPSEAYTKPGWRDPSKRMQLVFSDEFNRDGRTFYPGDDAYWEAVDLHYWGTNNLEWYDPEAITTRNGSLVITLSRKETHDLHYQGVILPGANNVLGLWPAIWTMGNLGRACYGASLEGMWPYTYDACDVGTLANQTLNGEPKAATVDGDEGKGGFLSFLPGQRLSRCTCPGESHPGPMHPDGTYVGRSSPEIDVYEAQINENTFIAQVSQSGQWAPFNRAYDWNTTSDNLNITDPAISQLNGFKGNVLQQATSVVTNTNPECYQLEEGCFSIYGFEYITWIADNKIAWTLNANGVGPDEAVQISARPVPQEPMYIIMNLGMSRNFGPVDFEHLTFPAYMTVDYVRVYQQEGSINIGCDPKDFPTKAYIEQYLESYQNPNLTTWRDDFKQPFPKNRLLGEC
ncbi:hypothetical protein VNI00_007434 [Paramarasmius palmivorus]|uniref:GH16 domain-containing protein n=1 Tax=Paramarasmius palmivorus TaxID=297713 RepID=A0AAW0D4W2_9AGAR